MDERRKKLEFEVFRPRRLFAAAMGGAGALWIAVFIYLLQFDGVPWRTFVSAVFFIAFFGVSVFYYVRTAIFVDASGVTYRGMLRTLSFSFDEIRKVDVLPGPVTVYAIRVGATGMHFTSFFLHHRRLVELLVERAGLAPVRV